MDREGCLNAHGPLTEAEAFSGKHETSMFALRPVGGSRNSAEGKAFRCGGWQFWIDGNRRKGAGEADEGCVSRVCSASEI